MNAPPHCERRRASCLTALFARCGGSDGRRRRSIRGNVKVRASIRAALGLAAAGAAAAFAPERAGAQWAELPAGAVYGDYAVGVATSVAVDAGQRFDPWNGAWGRPEYRALLRRIEASGQRRTVVFQLWYPAPPAAGPRLAGPRSPYPAAGGRRANYFDFFFQAGDLAPRLGAAAQVVLPEFVHLRGGGVLAELDDTARAAAFADLGRRILDRRQDAWQDAPAADGEFPVVVLAHGVAGSHATWSTLGEFLASHGYVVAAPTFVSDGGLPLVFHGDDAPFARGAAPDELRRAYALLLDEIKVAPYFYRLLFGQEGRGFAPPENFDPAAAAIAPGGAARVNAMMRNLFRQRVSDVGLVLRTVRLLGADPGACRTGLAVLGAAGAARTTADRGLCGLLAGRIDGERVGLAGHSLGSMTAQLAASHLPGVRAVLGLNNAPPFAWSPPEMFGAGEARDGLPAGSRRPLLLLIGDEDDFVQRIFVELLQAAVARAGGDPVETFPLAGERAAPDRRENPQPVALSAWRRATSDRVLVIVRDTDHFTLAEDFARRFPWPAFQRGDLPFGPTPERTRKPDGARAFDLPAAPGERYVQLGWTTAGAAGEVYAPHVIRDWYALAWFDWHVKDDRGGRERLSNPDPFGAATSVRRDLR